jgi:prepilin-type N-terminal cleavage/methylation domain-containing protein
MKKKYLKHNKKFKQGGFTIIELLVVIGIFALITAVAFINQGRLNSSVLLTNAAYETALAVREAQVYGLGVRRDESNINNNFEGEYGVNFDINNPRQIYVYSVQPSVEEGFSTTTNRAIYLYEFVNQRGNKIQALCFGDLGTDPCTSSSPMSAEIINISFRRPEPRAKFLVPPNDLTGLSPGPAYIVISTLDDKNCKVVVVQKTGQIQIEGPDKGHCLPQ